MRKEEGLITRNYSKLASNQEIISSWSRIKKLFLVGLDILTQEFTCSKYKMMNLFLFHQIFMFYSRFVLVIKKHWLFIIYLLHLLMNITYKIQI